MKSFFKIVFASMLGMVLLWVLLLILFISIGASSVSKVPSVKPCSVLEIDLNGVLVKERVSTADISVYYRAVQKEYCIGLNEWGKVLEKAAEDPNIIGISLKPGSVSAEPATLNAMRRSLLKFKKSGKFLYAFGHTFSQSGYYLASVADSIFMNPQGEIDFRGMAAQVFFYKDLLDRLSVDVQVVRHGSYKSAVEPFVASGMSEANRKQISAYLSSLWSTFCGHISHSRGVDTKKLNLVADNLMLYGNSQSAVSLHFVDALAYPDEYQDVLESRSRNVDSTLDKCRSISYSKYSKSIASNTAPYKVAIVYAVGSIVDGEGGPDEIGRNIAEELKKLRENKSVKAVVLRVNSGGGSALMSDRIWREVTLLKACKPVVVSMGDYAASGGYYISCAADCIVAEPMALTGSIGVFGMLPNLEKTLSKKLGIKVETVKTNTYSDLMGNGLRPLSTYESNVLQQGVERVYDTFVKRVADGRHLSVERVDEIAQGRVWTGRDALGIGLVDTLGGLDLAVRIAAGRAKLSNYAILETPAPQNFLDVFTTTLMQSRMSRQQASLEGTPLYPYYEAAEAMAKCKGIQTRLPYWVSMQ